MPNRKLLPAFLLVTALAANAATDSTWRIPLGGNSFAGATAPGASVTDQGVVVRAGKEQVFHVYFHCYQTGEASLELIGKAASGPVHVRLSGVTLKEHRFTAGSGDFQFKVLSYKAYKGYNHLTIAANVKADSALFTMLEVRLPQGDSLAFVRNNNDHDFYWGRRGPSVHINYVLPQGFEPAWFYTQVRAMPGMDPLGSYFMATGFRNGYFGMQVNSPTERHILFSIWSPFSTNDPKSIPVDSRVKLLRKGAGVTTNDFGGEGSGGQSWLNYPWTAGRAYGFLVHAEPSGPSNMTYTSWFYATEENRWRLIASWDRPQTSSLLSRLHSFLENFYPETGDVRRTAEYSRQWVADKAGKWVELTEADVTADATARKRNRLDYDAQAPSLGNAFLMENCGFYDARQSIGHRLKRGSSSKPPVDLSQLP